MRAIPFPIGLYSQYQTTPVERREVKIAFTLIYETTLNEGICLLSL